MTHYGIVTVREREDVTSGFKMRWSAWIHSIFEIAKIRQMRKIYFIYLFIDQTALQVTDNVDYEVTRFYLLELTK